MTGRTTTAPADRERHASDDHALPSGAREFAHDIRTPLCAMRLQVATLRKRFRDPDPRKRAEIEELLLSFDESLDWLEETTRTLLGSNPRRKPPAGPADVAVCAHETAGLMRHEFDQALVALAVDVLDDGDPLTAPIDPFDVRRVVMNLLRNARESIGAAGGAVLLQLSRAPDGFVELVVVDTGRGIPPAAIPRVMEEGYSTRPGDTGMGLALVKRLVEHAGGSIRLQSAVGEGTRCEIRLPPAHPGRDNGQTPRESGDHRGATRQPTAIPNQK